MINYKQGDIVQVCWDKRWNEELDYKVMEQNLPPEERLVTTVGFFICKDDKTLVLGRTKAPSTYENLYYISVHLVRDCKLLS